MSEDESRRFSYITSNLKNFNASGLRTGAHLQHKIEKIIAGDFDNESVFTEAEKGFESILNSMPQGTGSVKDSDIDVTSSNLKASNIMSYLDIDIEEVDDRLEEL